MILEYGDRELLTRARALRQEYVDAVNCLLSKRAPSNAIECREFLPQAEACLGCNGLIAAYAVANNVGIELQLGLPVHRDCDARSRWQNVVQGQPARIDSIQR